MPFLYEFLSYVEHKKRMLAIKYLMVPIDFHSTSFPTMEVNGNQQPFDYLKLFKMYIFFMFNMRMKLIQVYIGYRFTYKGKL